MSTNLNVKEFFENVVIENFDYINNSFIEDAFKILSEQKEMQSFFLFNVYILIKSLACSNTCPVAELFEQKRRINIEIA